MSVPLTQEIQLCCERQL